MTTTVYAINISITSKIPFLSFFKFIFNRSVVALHYCVGFCHISTWIGHRYTYVPSPLNIPPPPTSSHPSRFSQSTSLSSLHHPGNPHWLSMFHMVMCMFQYCSRFVPPSHPPLCHQVCPLCLHLHPALQIHSSMLSPRFHVCVRIRCLYFSFWLFSLCIIGPKFTHYIGTHSNMVFLWLSSTSSYTETRAPLSIQRWTSGLLLWPICCK